MQHLDYWIRLSVIYGIPAYHCEEPVRNDLYPYIYNHYYITITVRLYYTKPINFFSVLYFGGIQIELDRNSNFLNSCQSSFDSGKVETELYPRSQRELMQSAPNFFSKIGSNCDFVDAVSKTKEQIYNYIYIYIYNRIYHN
jgi:hypothetical protein